MKTIGESRRIAVVGVFPGLLGLFSPQGMQAALDEGPFTGRGYPLAEGVQVKAIPVS